MGWWTPLPRKSELQRIREECERLAMLLRVIAIRSDMQARALEEMLARKKLTDAALTDAALALEALEAFATEGTPGAIDEVTGLLKRSTDALEQAVQHNKL